ncbi:MAG: glycosyltransferase [Thermoplasmatota archaeon]
MAPSVSVVVTTRNEGRNLRHLLDSLAGQVEGPFDLADVILVDAKSTDNTAAVARSYADRLPMQVVVEPCGRGRGRNLGAALAKGDLLAFIDADCIANAYWLRSLVTSWNGEPDRVVAGRTQLTGYWAFTKLHRVELPHRGVDTTWPSCNLAYSRALFERLGGFDDVFVTAEDIDLNYRAVEAGATIAHAPQAIVYAKARGSITGFLKQAYWNGFGRKQLTVKHGGLWHEYSFKDMIALNGSSFWGAARMAAGLAGYLAAKAGRTPPHLQKQNRPKVNT